MHRPSPALVISLVALVFAMSGTAVAATGGDFILGKSNTASSMSTLTNAKGTALSLSSSSTAPPLKVSNSVQVPNLNASELDGQTSSAFLGVNGTAANSSELGGTPASGYIQGGGTMSDARNTEPSGTGQESFLSAPGSSINVGCQFGGDQLYLYGALPSNEQATWWNSGGGVGVATINEFSTAPLLDGASGNIFVIARVDTGSNISTYTLTESVNSSTGACYFTGQVVNSNG